VPETVASEQPKLLGAEVRRREDPRFLLGRGRYVDDIQRPGMVHACFVRSAVAHADVRSVDTAAAVAADGVHAVVTGADVADVLRPLAADSLHPSWQSAAIPALVADRTRYVGESLAVVVADDRYAAEDACDLVEVDYAPRPVVASISDAIADGAPLVHDGWNDNFYVRREFLAGDPDAMFAQAAGVVSLDLSTARQAGVPLETRGCVAEYDVRDDLLTVWSSTQVPHLIRTGLADALGLSEHRIRVIAPDVGGGFGIKCILYPEEIVVAHLAMRLGRPVKWIEDRHEHLLTAIHSRDHHHHVELAYAEDGTALALRARIHVDCGAYSVWPWTSTMDTGMALGILPGPYRIRHYACEAYSVATNKSPHGAYRGVSRPPACFSIERAMDEVAHRVGISPLEVRRRNLVRPDEFPYESITGLIYDSGSFVESIDLLADGGAHEELLSLQREGRAEGRWLGIGVACFTEQTAHATQEFVRRYVPIVPGVETALVRMDPSGSVTVQLSTHSHGQGHETTMAQLVADELALPLDRVRVKVGDTETAPYGHGTFASRSAVLGGGACVQAAAKVRELLTRFAGQELEVDVADLELAQARFTVRGNPARGVDIADLARWAYHRPERLPEGIQSAIEAVVAYDAPPGRGTFANAAHLVLIEVDPELGAIDLLRYVVVEDCGQMINPLIVNGQVHGGVAQGIGGALLEELRYDDDGQPTTTTLMDYLLPGATDVPAIRVEHLETPSPFTVHGIKGMGEGGTIAPGPAIAGALVDALSPLGHALVTELPLTSDRVQAVIRRLGEARDVT
jgi:carbon-monoxide dehydrogenase large subunit